MDDRQFSGHLSPSELEARIRLHCLPGIGPRRFMKLLQTFGKASAALSAPAPAWAALGLPAGSAAARRSGSTRRRVDHTLAWLETPSHHLLMLDDPRYPALLAELADPPPLLFVAGDPAQLERPQMAIVGSRRASSPGLDTALSFSRSLASAGFVITSGLALGVDGAAHKGALAVDGTTVAVLGTGLERLYPRRHIPLAAEIVARGGAIVSELPLDTAPLAENFPRRNRIISGLSLAVLVVEAGVASGSLITARLAAEQGRDVYAIPGPIHHPGARGCHQLIRDGATLVESPAHIFEELRGWQNLPDETDVDEPLDHPLLNLLRQGPLTSEELARYSGWPLPEVLSALTELELAQRIANEAGLWVYRA